MAVKARETLEAKQLNLVAMVILFAVIIGYTFLYNQVMNAMDNYQLKTMIGVVALMVMIVAFLLSLRFITTTYEMTLTHDRLKIIRKIFFWKKEVADIGMNEINELILLRDSKKVEGTTRNFTLGNIEGKRKYALHFMRQGKICCAKVQFSGKFYDSLKKQVKIE
ncbi:hypothetical protein [Acetobacterium bakii]|uniref:DUF304 domain-containing protein n=1 Tax=Acetobacterium bakii TaxID=52689 RepID=A0A0L6U232_9FIRM|nr:hypothetical protein [Acetobacterium bakii]KNZ42584.1 hypothetical protein AKG39_05365 [Acetobacterium bakii]